MARKKPKPVPRKAPKALTQRSQKITTYLWFDSQAEEAARFYVSVFKAKSRVNSSNPMMVSFVLAGQRFLALNGGPRFKFNESISLLVDCKDQAEVDYYWNALTADGGEESMCGWLKDRWGLSWQITPRRLMDLISDPDVGRARRAMLAMMEMRKIDIAVVERAADA